MQAYCWQSAAIVLFQCRHQQNDEVLYKNAVVLCSITNLFSIRSSALCLVICQTVSCNKCVVNNFQTTCTTVHGFFFPPFDISKLHNLLFSSFYCPKFLSIIPIQKSYILCKVAVEGRGQGRS